MEKRGKNAKDEIPIPKNQIPQSKQKAVAGQNLELGGRKGDGAGWKGRKTAEIAKVEAKFLTTFLNERKVNSAIGFCFCGIFEGFKGEESKVSVWT